MLLAAVLLIALMGITRRSVLALRSQPAQVMPLLWVRLPRLLVNLLPHLATTPKLRETLRFLWVIPPAQQVLAQRMLASGGMLLRMARQWLVLSHRPVTSIPLHLVPTPMPAALARLPSAAALALIPRRMPQAWAPSPSAKTLEPPRRRQLQQLAQALLQITHPARRWAVQATQMAWVPPH